MKKLKLKKLDRKLIHKTVARSLAYVALITTSAYGFLTLFKVLPQTTSLIITILLMFFIVSTLFVES